MNYNFQYQKPKKTILEALRLFLELSTHDRFRLPKEVREDSEIDEQSKRDRTISEVCNKN